MRERTYITKGELWLLLNDEAAALSTWLNGSDTEAPIFRYMLDNASGVTLTGELIQNQMIPLLLSKGVFTQTTVDKINAKIAELEAPASFGA